MSGAGRAVSTVAALRRPHDAPPALRGPAVPFWLPFCLPCVTSILRSLPRDLFWQARVERCEGPSRASGVQGKRVLRHAGSKWGPRGAGRAPDIFPGDPQHPTRRRPLRTSPMHAGGQPRGLCGRSQCDDRPRFGQRKNVEDRSGRTNRRSNEDSKIRATDGQWASKILRAPRVVRPAGTCPSREVRMLCLRLPRSSSASAVSLSQSANYTWGDTFR